MKILYLTSISVAFLLLTITASAQYSPFGKFKGIRLGTGTCRTTDSTLIINSGEIKRIYRLTPLGASYGGAEGGSKERMTMDAANGADWDMGSDNKAILNDITTRIDNDSGFTSEHITVISDF